MEGGQASSALIAQAVGIPRTSGRTVAENCHQGHQPTMLPFQEEDGDVTAKPEARPGQRVPRAEPRSPTTHQREYTETARGLSTPEWAVWLVSGVDGHSSRCGASRCHPAWPPGGSPAPWGHSREGVNAERPYSDPASAQAAVTGRHMPGAPQPASFSPFGGLRGPSSRCLQTCAWGRGLTPCCVCRGLFSRVLS